MSFFRPFRKRRSFQVSIKWDDEAGVWYVSDSDVPGLATEAPTQKEILDNLKELIPLLLEENEGGKGHEKDVPVHFLTDRTETLHLMNG